MNKRTLWVLLSVGSVVMSACGAPPVPPKEAGSEPNGPGPKGVPQSWKNKCDAAKGQRRPLVVEWPAPDRAALESQAMKGQLVVHYEGCELEVLRQCKAPAKFNYKYTAITPKEERETIDNTEKLYASIPVYAAKFEGKLAQSGQLNAEMTIVGEYGVEGEPPAIDQLEGDCKGATHVVTALTIGAFSFFAGSSREVGGSATVLGAGAGAESTKKSESLSRDGDTKSCGVSKRGDEKPPEGCGALMRIELTKVKEAGQGIPLECKPGTRLVGKECKAVEKPSELASEDKTFVDDKAGVGWGTRCFSHYKAGSMHYARAACQKGLEMNPSDDTRAAIFFNYALVEEKSGDPIAACEKLSQALALREAKGDKAVIKVLRDKIDALKCSEVTKKK